MSVADVVIATCQAAVPGRQFSDGQVVRRPDPSGHVVVYCDEGRVDRLLSVAADTDSIHVGWQVSCYGPTRTAATWLSRRITDHLLDVGIDVDGWTHGEVVHDFTRGPRSDDSVQELPTVETVDQFSTLLSRL